MRFERYQDIQRNRWERNAHKRRRWTPPEPEDGAEERLDGTVTRATISDVDDFTITYTFDSDPGTTPTSASSIWYPCDNYDDSSASLTTTTNGTAGSVIIDPGTNMTISGTTVTSDGTGTSWEGGTIDIGTGAVNIPSVWIPNGSSRPFPGDLCDPELFKKEQLKRKLREQWIEPMPRTTSKR